MIRLKNLNYSSFLQELKEKRIICFGAGGVFREFLRINMPKIGLMDKIDYILDSEPSKEGMVFNLGLREVCVTSYDKFVNSDVDLSGYIVILCVQDAFLSEIEDKLDGTSLFDNMICLYGITALSWGEELYPSLSNKLPRESVGRIPKVIHYCWFGDSPLGKIEIECISSWKEHCPDFEFRFWNESNYDISKTPLYVRQAYKAKKFAFVSDYARLDVIYKYGGVYFDTDVELLRRFDYLLSNEAFFGFESLNLISTGLGFGAMKNNQHVLELMKIYNQITFYLEGDTINSVACPYYHTDYFRRKGVLINNSTQVENNTLFLSSEYMCPLNCKSWMLELSDKTFANHRFALSWFEKKERADIQEQYLKKTRINERLLSDWRREYNAGV